MPTAPRGPCTAVPGCTQLKPCPLHPVKPWRRRPGAGHRTELSGSAEQARAQRVIERGRRICHVCKRPGKLEELEADHVIALTDGGLDIESNMAPIHRTPCHARKSAEESARARARARRQ